MFAWVIEWSNSRNERLQRLKIVKSNKFVIIGNSCVSIKGKNMNNWKNDSSFTPANYQIELVCSQHKFIVVGKCANINLHDTRYSEKLSESIIFGIFCWMPL